MRVKSGSKEKIFKYVTDCLGSVIEIKELVDGALESRLKCSYDAWGNRTVSGGTAITIDGYSILMSNLNPFYYRGYYYDVETKFYYLQTRYYDPALGRFINPDTIDYLEPKNINGLNLYAYCNNNPVMNVDPTGHSADYWGLKSLTVDYISSIPVAFIGGAAKIANNMRAYHTINRIANGVGKIGAGIGVALTFAEAAINIYDGIKNGEINGRLLSDTAVDIGISLGTILLASTIAGTMAPIVGNLVGFGIGVLVFAVDSMLPQVREWIKDQVYELSKDLVNAVKDTVNDIYKGIKGLFD